MRAILTQVLKVKDVEMVVVTLESPSNVQSCTSHVVVTSQSSRSHSVANCLLKLGNVGSPLNVLPFIG